MWGRIDGLRTLDLGTPGDLRTRLNALVLLGRKRATAGLMDLDYLDEAERPEHVGERLVLVDDVGDRVAEVEVTDVELTRLGEVTWEFADALGEGFTTVLEWRRTYEEYWAKRGQEVDDRSRVVCVRFRLV
ncbi:ASCH domain-containing protein [Longispora sp. NPDC051575]|uniref:ASCH domain-containing protein n=1 Tax=Longispora sp. NPDC051575 TaxID=3154943 RepID=UPI00343D72E1